MFFKHDEFTFRIYLAYLHGMILKIINFHALLGHSNVHQSKLLHPRNRPLKSGNIFPNFGTFISKPILTFVRNRNALLCYNMYTVQ